MPGDGDRRRADDERDRVRDDQRPVLERDAVGEPEREAEHEHAEVGIEIPADERIAIMWRICSVGESAIAMPQDEARMASSVVVDMQRLLWTDERDGDGGARRSVPQVAAFAIVAVERADHVGGSVHRASLAAARRPSPLQSAGAQRPEPS